ncbi:aldo/keto reductase [Paenibacillus methanolicus]|uniref:Diketogulonate reductase-like aldo/keto reductase n=1 Tax=Paenibacillus methanolicus TaxID=582686 RepID=A0A5S5CBI1_9BACL|nr:aldo/keto reductase [Paenibacillus methanolicus]TYP76735.1 diketogulonate reductase-like aldo/keto reductase [Paenibacillus methanolicus]
MVVRIEDCAVLQNGVRMPWLGFGSMGAGANPEATVEIVAEAIRAGYRSIDTASVYGNEASVGRAIRQSGVPREELFITTKLFNTDQGYEKTLRAFDRSMEKLGLEVLDLYLVHWAIQGKYKETWRAFEKLYRDGLVRAIGVSNFLIHHLEDLLADCEIVPMVNQYEYHPLLSQPELLAYCQSKGIQVTAYFPLMQGRLDHPTLAELSNKYKKTAAQIVLRWELQKGVVVIPKTSTAARLTENANIFDFILAEEDMERIDRMNTNTRFNHHPDDPK